MPAAPRAGRGRGVSLCLCAVVQLLGKLGCLSFSSSLSAFQNPLGVQLLVRLGVVAVRDAQGRVVQGAPEACLLVCACLCMHHFL